MKAKTKLTKLWSFLLSLVMLLSLLPTTALAAGSYPEANEVSVDDGKYFAEPGRYYFKNGASACSKDPNNYNAYYNPRTGTLTLDGYDGGSITAGGPQSKITVVLKGTNTINGNLVNSRGGDITITSESGGTLSITNTLSGSYSAIGIEAGYSSSYTTGNVTVKGDAKVTINMTHNGTNGYDNAYGIFAKENITISENASVDITCATPNNTTGGVYCNGLRADKNVIIDTTGTIKIDVTKAGKDSAYSYGICPMGTPTLTKVGEMEVQWKKHSTNSNYPGGAFTRGATFSDTDHAINVDETNCYASYRFGTPRTVTVENGTLTGPGVPNASGSGMFLENDTVNITPDPKAGKSGESIPFKKWTSKDVTLTSPTTENNSFTVPGKDVTVTATHSPFVGTPTFTPIGTTSTEGTLTFTTKVTLGDGNESFALVKEAEVDDTTKYKSINPSTTSPSSPYEYSSTVNFNNFPAGNYYVAEKLNGAWYLSEKFTMNYTAAPTVTYPDHVRVYNANKGIIGLGDKQYLATNDATSASTGYNGTQSYVARYDKSSGTLYLKGYQGVGAEGGIVAAGDLNIVVESDSSFTTSTTATNNLYGIQANGKLTISGSGKLTVTANGNGDVYGICANEGVTISAPLNVQVGKVDSSKNGPVYGIYTRSGAISLSGADKTITATGGTSAVYGVYNAANTSTAITNNGNIDIRGKLTVNLYNGGSNDGIRTDGGGTITLDGATVNIPSNFGTGIYNFKGNVVIENGSNVTLSSDTSYGIGIYARYGGDLTIENSTVTVSAKRLTASVEKGGLAIKDSIVDLTLDEAFYRVVETANNAANKIDLSTSGSVTLTASGNQTGSMIGGTVSITTPGTKCVKGTYYDYGSSQNYDGEYDGSSKTVLKFVHESAAPTTYTVSGTATSFNSDTDEVMIQLTESGASEPAYETVVKGNTAGYSIADVAPGTYTMKVMKQNHVAREYTVTVGSSNVMQDVKIHLKGDIDGNGTITTKDRTFINRHLEETKLLTDYQFLCGDIDGNGTITTKDRTFINRHLEETKLLW